ncbi:hypothetical protein [Streptomyces sp. NPDC002851]
MGDTATIAPDTADTTGPETADAEAPEAAVLSEIDLYLLAKPLAEALGDGWSEDTEESPAGFADKAIRLIHPDGRTIGVRHMWQGQAVQTFAVGGPAPKKSADTGETGTNRLPKGVRYSTGVHFATASPLEEILTAVRTVLLPAFDGQRPRVRSNSTPIPPAAEAPSEHTPDATTGTDQPAPQTDSASSAAKASTKTKARKSGGRRTASAAKRTSKRRTTPAVA